MATRTISTRMAIQGESEYKAAVTRINAELRTLRITPACAGKSILSRVAYAASRDHPRVRGEKNDKIFRSVLKVISPRVRGEKSRRSSVRTET